VTVPAINATYTATFSSTTDMPPPTVTSVRPAEGVTVTPTATAAAGRGMPPSPAEGVTVTPTATATASPGPCAPRPGVQVAAVPAGPARLQVTVSAATSLGTPTNALQTLQFGAPTNAVIEIGDGPPGGAAGNFALSLPPGTQQVTFVVRRTAPGPSTVPLVVVDGCGAWPTFVGGGPDAF
jgi:hypothetical protein